MLLGGDPFHFKERGNITILNTEGEHHDVGFVLAHVHERIESGAIVGRVDLVKIAIHDDIADVFVVGDGSLSNSLSFSSMSFG